MRYYFTTYFCVVFSGFTAPHPSQSPIAFAARICCEALIAIITSLAALAKAGIKVI
jgi:hypothetical protein